MSIASIITISGIFLTIISLILAIIILTRISGRLRLSFLLFAVGGAFRLSNNLISELKLEEELFGDYIFLNDIIYFISLIFAFSALVVFYRIVSSIDNNFINHKEKKEPFRQTPTPKVREKRKPKKKMIILR